MRIVQSEEYICSSFLNKALLGSFLGNSEEITKVLKGPGLEGLNTNPALCYDT